MDPLFERTTLALAYALFMNRLHVLRLTEVVRLRDEPDKETGDMALPEALDAEMRQQAVDYVLTCLPEEFSPAIRQASSDWLRPA